MTPSHKWQHISLLWPDGTDIDLNAAPQLSDNVLDDLDLAHTIHEIASEHGYEDGIRRIVRHLSTDPDVIRYRQDVLADMVDLPGLADRLEALLPSLVALDSFGYFGRPGQSPLHEVVWRVGQLESYVDAVEGLRAIFVDLARDSRGRDLQSEGLRRLRAMIDAITGEETYQHMLTTLPELVASVRNIASITVGVNLDDHLRPYEATLLAVNRRKYRGEDASLLGALFGRSPDQKPWEGIAPLHTAGTDGMRSPYAGRSYAARTRGDGKDPMLHPLFRDLAEVLKKTSRPIAAALQRYVRMNLQLLGNLGAELTFLLGAVRLVQTLRACGLPVCRPEIVPTGARVCELDDTYNLNLALRLLDKGKPRDLRGEIVVNDVAFGPAGRIFVLTGPNHGGKTTYTQAIGLIQVLAQAGLYVPGRRARISPVDGIYTHFPVEERPDSHAGRLGEEAQRLSDIFARATQHSLVLLNESLASTSPGESLYLARDMVRVLRRMGVRAVYATHLHELAEGVDALNAETPGDSQVTSLVARARETNGSGSVQRTYEIVPGPPMGHSYAREIAAQYGISYEQLIALLRERGLVNGDHGD